MVLDAIDAIDAIDAAQAADALIYTELQATRTGLFEWIYLAV